MKFQQEETFKHSSRLGKVLNYILALVPNSVKGEMLEYMYNVSLKEFCEALKIKLL